MKRFLMLLCTGLLFVTTSALAVDLTTNVYDPDAWQAIKDAGMPPSPPNNAPDSGGETPATATVIPALPYTDSDNTCGHVQNLTASCGANASPDLFYVYNPTANASLRASLCGSGYDTVLYILENGVEIACNDDFCGLQSQIDFNVVAGRTYHIGVSGFSTACGPYTLNVRVLPPCNYACPANAQRENEPPCGPNYVDNWNGGCNSTPPVFQQMTCSYICGETGTYLFNGQNYRDTDWFRIYLPGGTYVFDGMGEGFNLQKLVIADGCPANILYSTQTNCDPITFTVPAGYYVFWAGPTVFSGLPCGSRYWISLTGPGVPDCGVTAVEPSTWGNLKAMYR